MTWDPSIILGFKQYTGPDPQETLRTMSQLSLQGVQKQQAQASLADMLNQQQQAQALRRIYAENANTPERLPSSLLGIGAGPQAFAAQDQQSQMAAQQLAAKKMQEQGQREEFERHLRPLMGVKNDADIAAVKEKWRRDGYPEENIAILPDSYEEAAPKIKLLLGSVMPVEKQAELAQKDRAAQLAAGKAVTDTGTGQRMGFDPEKGTYSIPIGAPKPQKPSGGGGAGGAAGSGLTPEALDSAANRYHETGEMIPAGQGKSGLATKVLVLNRAAELYPDDSVGGNKASFKADTDSLKHLQVQADAIGSLESTAFKNMKQALAMASKIVDAGSPLFNKAARAAAQALGSADQAAFNTAMMTARTEAAKILSGSTGNGALSDSARHEVEELMRGDSSVEQFTAVANTLETDMNNRAQASREAIAAVRARMRGGKKGAGKTPEAKGGPFNAGDPAKAGGGEHPPIVQNGHTYTWNAAAGEYQ